MTQATRKEDTTTTTATTITEEEEEEERKRINDRKQAIDDCLQWMNEQRPGGGHDFDQIEFRVEPMQRKGNKQASFCPTMVGLYSKKRIPMVVPDPDNDNNTNSNDGSVLPNTLFVIPKDCILRVHHDRFQTQYKAMKRLLREAMDTYKEQKEKEWKQQKTINPWDVYQKNHGRILDIREVELIIILTMIVFAKIIQENQQQQQQSSSSIADDNDNDPVNVDVSKKITTEWFQQACAAAKFWTPFLNTWPKDFSSLIFHWTDEEVQSTRGTSLFGLIHRLRKEKNHLFDTIVEPMLLIPITDIIKTDNNNNKTKNNNSNHHHYDDFASTFAMEGSTWLRQAFDYSIAGVYSRMHGIIESAQSEFQLIPLLDLINGARQDDDELDIQANHTPVVNVQVLEFPSYTALVTNPAAMTKQNGGMIPSGQELFFDYGSHPNINYISKFGFLPLSQGQPIIHPLDMVTLIPPSSLLPKPSDIQRWQVLAQGTDVSKEYYQNHFLFTKQDQKHMLYGNGTPFAYFGNRYDMKQFRSNPFFTNHYKEGENNDDDIDPKPPATPPMYLERHINFIMTYLLEDTDIVARASSSSSSSPPPQETIIECCDIGFGLIQMIDERLQSLEDTTITTTTTTTTTPLNGNSTNNNKNNNNTNNKSNNHKKEGNFQTAYYFKCLEKDILQQWKHSIAIYYGVYEEGMIPSPFPTNKDDNTNHNNNPTKQQQQNKQPSSSSSSLSSSSSSCVVCQTSFRCKRCKNCLQVYYCSRQCQIDDWKFGNHKQICKQKQKQQKQKQKQQNNNETNK